MSRSGFRQAAYLDLLMGVHGQSQFGQWQLSSRDNLLGSLFTVSDVEDFPLQFLCHLLIHLSDGPSQSYEDLGHSRFILVALRHLQVTEGRSFLIIHLPYYKIMD
jgi:hypothetical protein